MSVTDVFTAFAGFDESLCAAEFANATRRMHAARAQVEVAAQARRAALADLYRHGWTYEDIGKLVGISKQAVYQTLKKEK